MWKILENSNNVAHSDLFVVLGNSKQLI